MTRANKDDLVALGYAQRTRGLQGEVRVQLYNPESETLMAVRTVTLRKNGEERLATIERVAPMTHGGLSVKLVGVGDAAAAKALVGHEVCVRRGEFPPLPSGEWYHHDLVGLAAVLEDGTALGEVVRVEAYPSVDAVVVRTGEEEREAPLAEPYLVRVDLERGEITLAEWGDLEPQPVRRKRSRGR